MSVSTSDTMLTPPKSSSMMTTSGDKAIRLAKRALQQNENMTEDEAHRYIQKRSMELRISKLELSERILKSYQKKS